MNIFLTKRRFRAVLCLFALLSAAGFAETRAGQEDTDDEQASLEESKLVLGWLQNIRMYPGGMLMKAKLDSGARSNAIHAENMKLFERNGVTMVSFTILKDHDDPQSESVELEVPLEKQVNIKLRFSEERDERPVVKLDFCMAGTRHTALFSLTQRTDFNYPVLLGREFMKDHYLVDPSESFTHRTGCRRE